MLKAFVNAFKIPDLRKKIFGADATGRPNTPFNKAYNAAAGRIDCRSTSGAPGTRASSVNGLKAGGGKFS